MWLELFFLIIGVSYGFLHKGIEDTRSLLKAGATVGVVLGIILGPLALFYSPGLTGLGLDQTGLGGILLLVITLVILFILGVFLGDLVEETIKG